MCQRVGGGPENFRLFGIVEGVSAIDLSGGLADVPNGVDLLRVFEVAGAARFPR